MTDVDLDEGDRTARRFHDHISEQGLVGHLLTFPNRIETALALLDAEDFTHHGARTAFLALGDLWLSQQEIGAISVGDRALELDPMFQRIQLLDWQAETRAIGSVETVAHRLSQLAAGRRLRGLLSDTLGRVNEASADPLALATHLAGQLEGLGRSSSEAIEMSTAADIAMRPETDVPWLIPGLLFRQDALVLVAGEGAGKSLLGRQVALCAEAGLHPFTRYRVPPIRVLTVDLENKKRAMTDSFRMALKAVRSEPGFERWTPQGQVWEQPGGLNLLAPADRRRFTDAIRRTRPDLLFFGPIYKSFRAPSGAKEDQAALEVTAFLDDLRARYDFGLWLEAHAPFGSGGVQRELRPFGTTVWQRWPEYGKSFRRDEKSGQLVVGSFRGDRTRVYWPERLLVGQGAWPFSGDYGARADLRIFGWPQPRTVPD